MIELRPSETRLNITSDTAPWSEATLPPNRSIAPKAAMERLEKVEEWLNSESGRAPKPDWEMLDAGFHFESENIEETEAKGHQELDFEFRGLELTEHQKLMLKPPEQRMREIVYPEAIQRRTRISLRREKNNDGPQSSKATSLARPREAGERRSPSTAIER